MLFHEGVPVVLPKWFMFLVLPGGRRRCHYSSVQSRLDGGRLLSGGARLSSGRFRTARPAWEAIFLGDGFLSNPTEIQQVDGWMFTFTCARH